MGTKDFMNEREKLDAQIKTNPRTEGLARCAVGACLVGAGVFLRLNPDMQNILVTSQRPMGIDVPLWSNMGILIWLLAPYALPLVGLILIVRGGGRAI